MLLLGIDLGTSSIKVSVVDAYSRKSLASASHPGTEAPILSPEPGWAEQVPDEWWSHVQKAISKAHATKAYDPREIGAIGIAYQMHGLVLVDRHQQVLRNAIIWCDSRAVETGNKALEAIGRQKALKHLLNSPGNFTASKLGWVKVNEPATYAKVAKVLLPGDFIGLRLTGETTTSISALSEGIFWDFLEDRLSEDVMRTFGFDRSLIPEVRPVFSEHGKLNKDIAQALGLRPGIPVSYKAGDQPNNALSLNVLQPGEVAATAGTSGVIYGVSERLMADPLSRVNTFAHVNYAKGRRRLGILLCINGTGILNRWVRDQWGGGLTYEGMNELAATAPIGSAGLRIVPFGNGAERVLENRLVGAQVHGIDLNVHTRAHVFRAAQEGIAFSFRYGLDILRETGVDPKVIRAGRANLFLSPVFREIFTGVTGVPIDLYESDGSLGAALGAGIGAGAFASEEEAFKGLHPLQRVEPAGGNPYEEAYRGWKDKF